MSNFETILKSVKDLAGEYKAKKAEAVKELQSQFANEITIFKEVPELSIVMWEQYTPYFNDGDTCEFGVNEIHAGIGLNKEDLEDVYRSYDLEDLDETEGGMLVSYFDLQPPLETEWCKEYKKKFIEKASKITTEENLKKIKDFISDLSSIPEDVMYDLFGDHSSVKITRDGVQVEAYEHD